MTLFWKAAAGVLIAVILGLILGKQERDISVMLSMTVCAMGAIIALTFLEPVVDLLRQLEQLGNLGGDLLSVLLKAMGIAMVTEIAGTICADSGSSALGKTMQLLGAAAILWLSLPLFQTFLTLIQDILGEL